MGLTIEQALQQGVDAHKEGNLEEAERCYRIILQSQPLHPHANHNLGLIAVAVSQTEAALPLFKTAVEANSKIEQFWLSYIEALVKQQQFEEGKVVLEQAKKEGFSGDNINALEKLLVPITQVSESISDMENKDLTSESKLRRRNENKKNDSKNGNPPQIKIDNLLHYYQNQQYGDAEKLAVAITDEFPNHPFSWKVLGAVVKQTGRISESLLAIEKSVQLAPQDAEAHYNLGITLQELGRLDEAEVSYRQAIDLRSDFADAHSNLGNTLKQMGRFNEAEASWRLAIMFKPEYVVAHFNLGMTLTELGRLEEAEESHRQAIMLKPDFAEAHYNLGNSLQGMGRLEEGEESYRQAITLKSNYAEAYNNLGYTCRALGKLKEAESSYKQAIVLKPEYVKAYYNLGNLLQTLGRLDEAESSYRQAIVLKPDYADAHSNLSATLLNLGKHNEGLREQSIGGGVMTFDLKYGFSI